MILQSLKSELVVVDISVLLWLYKVTRTLHNVGQTNIVYAIILHNVEQTNVVYTNTLLGVRRRNIDLYLWLSRDIIYV